MGEAKKKKDNPQMWTFYGLFREFQTTRDLCLACPLKTDEEMERNTRVIEAIDEIRGLEAIAIDDYEEPPFTGRDAFVPPNAQDVEAVTEWKSVFTKRMNAEEEVHVFFTHENIDGVLHAIRTLAAKEAIDGRAAERLKNIMKRLKSAKSGQEIEGEVERTTLKPVSEDAPAN